MRQLSFLDFLLQKFGERRLIFLFRDVRCMHAMHAAAWETLNAASTESILLLM